MIVLLTLKPILILFCIIINVFNIILLTMGIKKIITQLDLGATSNPLYINQTTSINSFYCGVVSIIGLVFLAFYIMNKFSL